MDCVDEIRETFIVSRVVEQMRWINGQESLLISCGMLAREFVIVVRRPTLLSSSQCSVSRGRFVIIVDCGPISGERVQILQTLGRLSDVAVAMTNRNDLIIDGSRNGHWVAGPLIVRESASRRMKTPTRVAASVGTWWWQEGEKNVGGESWLLWGVSF